MIPPHQRASSKPRGNVSCKACQVFVFCCFGALVPGVWGSAIYYSFISCSKKALYLTLCYLDSQTTYREISELFGVSQSTIFECVQRVVDIVCHAVVRYITWPNEHGIIIGIIGVVDGFMPTLKLPMKQADFLDRTRKHNMNLMALSTPDKKFASVQCGFLGSAYDSRF